MPLDFPWRWCTIARSRSLAARALRGGVLQRSAESSGERFGTELGPSETHGKGGEGGTSEAVECEKLRDDLIQAAGEKRIAPSYTLLQEA